VSSTFHIACLSHDPACQVTDLGYDSSGEAEARIRSGIEGHPNCDLLIIRWSGGPVEIGCPGHERRATTRPPANWCWCRIPHSHTKWASTTWLRVLAHARLAHALPEKLAPHSDLSCWTEQRVWRLREEISLELPGKVDESAAPPTGFVHPPADPQVDATAAVDEPRAAVLNTSSMLPSWKEQPDGTWSMPVGDGVLTVPADTSPARRDQLLLFLALSPVGTVLRRP